MLQPAILSSAVSNRFELLLPLLCLAVITLAVLLFVVVVILERQDASSKEEAAQDPDGWAAVSQPLRAEDWTAVECPRRCPAAEAPVSGGWEPVPAFGDGRCCICGSPLGKDAALLGVLPSGRELYDDSVCHRTLYLLSTTKDMEQFDKADRYLKYYQRKADPAVRDSLEALLRSEEARMIRGRMRGL